MRNRQQERPLWHAQYELASALTTHRGEPSVHHSEALAFVESAECTVEALLAHADAVCGRRCALASSSSTTTTTTSTSPSTSPSSSTSSSTTTSTSPRPRPPIR